MFRRDRHLCPVERAGGLDNNIRRWLQNPRKILMPYVREGMTVLDIGCGPGFFALDMAEMVGESGRVIAVDLQAGMLQKLRNKIAGTAFEKRITLHKSEANRIGISETVDFVLAFYVMHELPHQKAFFEEVTSILKPGGQILIVEPPLHVSQAAFETSLAIARNTGFTVSEGPKIFLSKTALVSRK